ncbi:single-stranded-DNA-specific exonuclease C-terminal domain-containing protein [Pediococcus pentosaceus]
MVQKLKNRSREDQLHDKSVFELNFVKIENGLLFINAEAEQHQLTEAPAYKKREELIQTQEKLLYSSGDELSAIVERLMNVDNKGVS